MSCTAVTGTNSKSDITVTVPVYITDILDETIDDSQPLRNTVTVDYDYEADSFDDTDTSERDFDKFRNSQIRYIDHFRNLPVVP